ncbi:hypothetical protein M413DRAFT_235204 [Hebeloma cylindrosporum]|uniref:F-box domain-containing protein n=1 Tax=Hebeloma cylindrosporum TaxID=76867 RepID=A0A0C3BQY0_HEBCY|nr:hypothetical protein M413DRAFT_235204 [Hebeloma cylindrosporum h7]
MSAQKVRRSKPGRQESTVRKALNTRGLTSLPQELYVEIISHLPAYPIPREDRAIKINPDVCVRHITLSSVTQTCHDLRPVFLRYLWQRIAVFYEDNGRRSVLSISTYFLQRAAIG